MAKNSNVPKGKGVENKDTLNVANEPGKSKERRLAEVVIDPNASAMNAVRMFSKGSFGAQDTTELFTAIAERSKAAGKGNIDPHKAMLAAQAETLNAIFTEMARRAALNMGEYIGATESYMRLGLKAQAQCRASIEALDKLNNQRVQTVRHVHVNEGAQAVIADQFHHHAGGQTNDEINEQPHATGTAGESAALLGSNTQGNGVPISSGKRSAAMQNARG